jgi:hypothetical protein
MIHVHVLQVFQESQRLLQVVECCPCHYVTCVMKFFVCISVHVRYKLNRTLWLSWDLLTHPTIDHSLWPQWTIDARFQIWFSPMDAPFQRIHAATCKQAFQNIGLPGYHICRRTRKQKHFSKIGSRDPFASCKEIKQQPLFSFPKFTSTNCTVMQCSADG